MSTFLIVVGILASIWFIGAVITFTIFRKDDGYAVWIGSDSMDYVLALIWPSLLFSLVVSWLKEN